MCMRIQEKELSEAEGWKTGLRALEWFRMRERERDRERETERETERERERERRRAVVNTNIEFTRTLHIKFLEAAVLLLSKYKCRFFPLPQLIVNGQLLSNMLYIICLVKVM